MLLSRRDYSEFELRRKLECYDSVEVENTINKLKRKDFFLMNGMWSGLWIGI